MEGQPPVAVEPTNRWSRWFLRLSSAQTRRVALLLVLVATAAFGGLDTVDKQVTPFKSGEEFSDGEFTVTVERARLVDELKGTYGSAKPGKIYLGVVTTVRNDGTVPGRLRDQLDLRDVPQESSSAPSGIATVQRSRRSVLDSPSSWCSRGCSRTRLRSLFSR